MAAAGEFLQFLVGFLHTITTHDGLNGFGQHFPVGVQVGSQGGFGHLQLAQAALGRVVGQESFELDLDNIFDEYDDIFKALVEK